MAKNTVQLKGMQKSIKLPRHIGLILDGNRRWAVERGLAPVEGHKQGFESFRKVADACLEAGIKYLSVYAFSTENWSRSKDEVSFLMRFVKVLLKQYTKELSEKNVRFLWFGCEKGLDQATIKSIRTAESKTKSNTSATFCFCFNYGGQQEIVDAVKQATSKDLDINIESIGACLYGGSDVPPVDFVIRTSGEQRLSNFMLWRSAYSELYFTEKKWPDFGVEDLGLALADYDKRQRRYGH